MTRLCHNEARMPPQITMGECFRSRCLPADACTSLALPQLQRKTLFPVVLPLKRYGQAHKRQSIPISKFVTGLSPKSSLVFWTSVFVSTYGSDRSDDRTEGMACSLRMSDDAAVASSRFKTTRKSSSNSNVRNLSLQAAHFALNHDKMRRNLKVLGGHSTRGDQHLLSTR